MRFPINKATASARIKAKACVAILTLLSASCAMAQDSAPKAAPSAPAANPARELVVSKCLQCHSDAIWRDQRQDARAWEATLYRMLARGAVWTGDEIKTMASYLATDFGPNAPKVASTSR
jgi:hypothetical protein